MSQSERWKATIFVGGLAPDVMACHVHDAFLPFGEIKEVNMPKSNDLKSDSSHKGFAYVEFEEVEDALEAVENMDKSDFFGRTLKVSLAKGPKADGGLGNKTAIWEQDGWIAKHTEGKTEPEIQDDEPEDPTRGLKELDQAGPRRL